MPHRGFGPARPARLGFHSARRYLMPRFETPSVSAALGRFYLRRGTDLPICCSDFARYPATYRCSLGTNTVLGLVTNGVFVDEEALAADVNAAQGNPSLQTKRAGCSRCIFFLHTAGTGRLRPRASVLTIRREGITLQRARLALGNDINAGSPGSQKAPTQSPASLVQPMTRARWRRRFASTWPSVYWLGST
jgi:hypothetical protein